MAAPAPKPVLRYVVKQVNGDELRALTQPFTSLERAEEVKAFYEERCPTKKFLISTDIGVLAP